MKNRIFALILSAMLCINLTACTANNKSAADFTDKEWFFYDEFTGEHLCMNLRSDGSYSYHCQCGEPVGDSDLYEQYTYDAKEGIITLEGDGETAEIKVLRSNEYHLMLEIEGEIKDFQIEEVDALSSFWTYEGEKYFADYNSRCTVLEIQDDKIVYGPVNYDPEGSYEDGPFEEYELSEDASFAYLSITSYNSVQDGQEYEEFYESGYREMDFAEAKEVAEYGAGLAFLWLDSDLKVEKILYFGECAVTADYLTITVEAENAKGVTREKLDAEIEEGYYDAAKINEDGSITYLMLEEQMKALPEGMIKMN